MKISVVIATYNADQTLARALESVCCQTYSDIEIIVVDGISTDNSVAIVKRYQYIHDTIPIRSFVGRDSGIYDAINKGVSLAVGDWVFFMGADDVLYDEYVFQDIIAAENGNDIQHDLILGHIEFDNKKVRKSSISAKTRYINTVHHQSAFYRRKLFDLFTYNSDYRISADYELNLKIFLERMNVLRIERLVCIVGMGGVSGRVDYRGYAEEIEIRNNYLQSGCLRTIMNCATRMRYIYKKCLLSLFWKE